MTEEEAKSKWCPYADNAPAPEHFNRGTIGLARCIGSACMAWRRKKRFGPDPDEPENCTELPPTEGYCGLAGRPE